MDVTKLMDKAKIAAERSNYDYAIDLYLQLLEFQPNNTNARKKLRDAEVRKLAETNVNASTPGGWVKGFPSLVAAQFFLLIRKFDKAMGACEAFLKRDPYNTTVLSMLAQAANGAGHKETAIQVYEDARTRNGTPKNKMQIGSHCRLLRRLGDIYEETGQFPKAAQCFEEILKYIAKDREAERRIRDLAARRSMVEGRWEDAGKEGYRGSLKSEDEAKKLEDSHRDIRTREDVQGAIKRVKGDIQQDPENTRLYTQLGDLYKIIKDWAQARTAYDKARELDPTNFLVQERLGDLRLSEMDQQIQRLGAGDATKAQAAKLRGERTQYALAEYQKRAKARPQDFPTRFKLANILFDLKRYKDAGTQYQFAARDPKTRRSATYRLGLCLQQQGLMDLAIEQFQRAASGASVVSLEVKQTLYTLGQAYEQQDRLGEALETYKKVFDVDMNFMDVSAKIEELYKKGAKSAV